MSYYFYKIHNFNINNAKHLLDFSIRHINKNMEINNELFSKDIRKKLLNKLQKINEYYLSFIKIDYKAELKNFLQRIKNSQDESDFDEKLISYMIIIHEELYHQTPRLIQIISLLYYLEGYKEKYGLILEVLTGEGKTLTISFLALYLSILGNKVDILTSSPVLAERDAKSREKFFNYFGISCDFCRNDSKKNLLRNNGNMFECYKQDIVYGDGLSLIGDILRSEFLGKRGRGDRPFDYIIIDEIDNICIDNLRNIVELVDNFPGFKYLEYLYFFIYKVLKKKVNTLENNNKKNYKEELRKNAELIIHEVSEETRIFLNHNRDLKYDDEKKILIPENCFDFINSRVEHWCKMAFDAMFNFEKDKNYFISKDEYFGFDTIKPIDYVNTGVILQNSVWSGLHQFLQIKEGLTFVEENINSSFMSYLSFFRRYKLINGITGTLGSKRTQKAINKIYKINLLRMPPFKERQLQINEPKIFSEEQKYNSELISEIIENSAHHKRVVLVLFEYMAQVNAMHKYLKEHRKEFKLINTEIISYMRSDIKNDFLEKEMKPNTVILSTNLSGRGTDIKINSEVKRNGGLHVIITFLPYNERIEKQAQGRAGRCGDRGSSIIILLSNNTYEILEERRNKYELEQYKFLINLYTPQLDLNQRFFEKFCERLQLIRNENKTISNAYYSVISDLKERWSMFILKNDINSFMNDLIHPNLAGQVYKLYERITTKKFKALMKEIEVDINDYEFSNPFYQMKSNLPNKAYQTAIEKSPGFSIGAYYNQAYSYIVNQDNNYQILVYNNLKTLRTICNKFIYQYTEIIKMFFEIHKDDLKKIYSNSLVSQCLEKKIIMKTFLDNVNHNINEIIAEIKKGFEYDNSLYKSECVINNDLHLDPYIKYIDIKIKDKWIVNENDLKISKNTMEYFSDFGVEFFFEIECCKKPDYCISF